jgi:mono/diheme cytochrome c family protein
MRRVLKWFGIVLLGILALIVVVSVVVVILSNSRLNQSYDTASYDAADAAVVVASEPSAVARGQHLTQVLCEGCHGENLAGKVIFDQPVIGRVYAPNITPGGLGAELSDADIVRAVRHGVHPDGRPLLIMPAESLTHMSDADLGAVLAYLRSVPAVDGAQPTGSLGPMGRLLLVSQGAQFLAAEHIDHTAARPAAPAPGASAAYGDYLVNMAGCKNCHGPQLGGGKPAEPGAPLAPNLTPASELASWTEADFVQAIRTGVVPTGRTLSESMPWRDYAHFTDEELSAIWLHLQAVPPVPLAQ